MTQLSLIDLINESTIVSIDYCPICYLYSVDSYLKPVKRNTFTIYQCSSYPDLHRGNAALAALNHISAWSEWACSPIKNVPDYFDSNLRFLLYAQSEKGLFAKDDLSLIRNQIRPLTKEERQNLFLPFERNAS